MVAPLPENVSMEQGACLGIPGITAHRAVHVAGDLNGRTVLVQGAAGAVGLCAVDLAWRAGARVIGTVRAASDEAIARKAGAQEVILNEKDQIARVKVVAPKGVDHIVEVAFGANIEAEIELLKADGSVATYATNEATPKVPVWLLVFKNIRLYFLGNDDFPQEAKLAATRDLNAALAAGWPGFVLEAGEAEIEVRCLDLLSSRANSSSCHSALGVANVGRGGHRPYMEMKCCRLRKTTTTCENGTQVPKLATALNRFA